MFACFHLAVKLITVFHVYSYNSANFISLMNFCSVFWFLVLWVSFYYSGLTFSLLRSHFYQFASLKVNLSAISFFTVLIHVYLFLNVSVNFCMPGFVLSWEFSWLGFLLPLWVRFFPLEVFISCHFIFTFLYFTSPASCFLSFFVSGFPLTCCLS